MSRFGVRTRKKDKERDKKRKGRQRGGRRDGTLRTEHKNLGS
jgi:hypothetical protein